MIESKNMAGESESSPPLTPAENAFKEHEGFIRSATTEEVQQLLADPSQAQEYIDHLVKKDLERTRQINKLIRDVIANEALGNVGFNERLLLGVKRAQEAGGVVGLIRSDLDNFKGVNALLGHDLADRVLYLATMAWVNAAKRKADTVAVGDERYIIADDLKRHPDQAIAAREHGDELAAVVPGTPIVGAMSIAHTAQRTFMADLFREFPKDAARLNTGMSVGIMVLDFSPIRGRQIPSGSPEQLTQMLKEGADDALYVAKEKKGSIFPFDPKDSRILARQAARSR